MRAGGWLRFDAAARQLTLTVHVQPGAAASAAAGLHGEALKIRIAAPAVDNRANAALIEFLCGALGVRPAQIRLQRGAHARRKVIVIHGADAALRARLEALAGSTAAAHGGGG